MSNFQILEWDSNFFGFGTARVLPAYLEKETLEKILKKLQTRGIRLAYWSVESAASFEVNHLGGRLVDRKVTYQRDLRSSLPQPARMHAKVEEFRKGMPEDQLLALAVQAGEFSRFNRDPQFPHEKFMALYHEWMRKSLVGEMAEKVLIIQESNQIAGMVTLSSEDKHGEIGLIAIDEAFRGKGYGEALVHAAQDWSRQRGFAEAQVVTQRDNQPACRLYEKCGYTLKKLEYFYHFWL